MNLQSGGGGSTLGFVGSISTRVKYIVTMAAPVPKPADSSHEPSSVAYRLEAYRYWDLGFPGFT